MDKIKEVRAQPTFYKLYGLDSAEIITYSDDTIIETANLNIKVIPLAKWLLLEFNE